MKKSKIIVPALGIIALSTAASITGTVAWFTASRSASILTGEFAVTKTTNNLKVVLTEGAGTNVDGNQVSIESNTKLTDASFSHKNRTVYAPDANGTALDSEKEFNISNATTTDAQSHIVPSAINIRSQSGNPAVTVLSVMTWDMAVTVEFGSVAGDMALYLDPTSDVQVKTGESTYSSDFANMKTAKGFRMAFIPLDTTAVTGDEAKGALYRVWADNQYEVDPEDNTKTLIKHVNTSSGASAILGIPYEAPYLLDKAGIASATLPNDSAIKWTDAEHPTTQASTRPDCLGKFTYAENTQVTLNYRVVCWYEGTDPEIVNRQYQADYQSVKANIVLTAIKLGA